MHRPVVVLPLPDSPTSPKVEGADLRSMIGDERLQFLVKDLKDIASKNPAQARPLFLLAYIDYNTGNERLAETFSARSNGVLIHGAILVR